MPVTEQIIRRDAEKELFRLLHSIGSCNEVKVRSGKLEGHINDGTRRSQFPTRNAQWCTISMINATRNYFFINFAPANALRIRKHETLHVHECVCGNVFFSASALATVFSHFQQATKKKYDQRRSRRNT